MRIIFDLSTAIDQLEAAGLHAAAQRVRKLQDEVPHLCPKGSAHTLIGRVFAAIRRFMS